MEILKNRNIIIVFFSVGIFFFSRKENENMSHDPIFFQLGINRVSVDPCSCEVAWFRLALVHIAQPFVVEVVQTFFSGVHSLYGAR